MPSAFGELISYEPYVVAATAPNGSWSNPIGLTLRGTANTGTYAQGDGATVPGWVCIQNTDGANAIRFRFDSDASAPYMTLAAGERVEVQGAGRSIYLYGVGGAVAVQVLCVASIFRQ